MIPHIPLMSKRNASNRRASGMMVIVRGWPGRGLSPRRVDPGRCAMRLKAAIFAAPNHHPCSQPVLRREGYQERTTPQTSALRIRAADTNNAASAPTLLFPPRFLSV